MTPSPSHSYDPAFAEEDANIILQSSDATLYRMHTFTLRTTSGFFRAMLTLPQHESASTEERIILDEPSKVLGTLLRIISGFRLQIWETFDHEDSEVEGVLAAAEKYDMEGALSVIRSIREIGGVILTRDDL